jgi:hypothetical protein
MAVLTPVTINRTQLKKELKEFKSLLNNKKKPELKERQDILPFFDKSKNLCAYMGTIYNSNILAKNTISIAREFDIFGDHTADMVIGDARKHAYTIIEFEDATEESIFVKKPNKKTLEWSPRFEHGSSQLHDWILWIDNNKGNAAFQTRFGARSIRYNAILIIGRDKYLPPDLRERMDWRSEQVVIASKNFNCITFDELYRDLDDRFNGY